MHKKNVCAKKWTKIDPNLETKTIFFPRIQRTLLVFLARDSEKCFEMTIIAKPKYEYF